MFVSSSEQGAFLPLRKMAGKVVGRGRKARASIIYKSLIGPVLVWSQTNGKIRSKAFQSPPSIRNMASRIRVPRISLANLKPAPGSQQNVC